MRKTISILLALVLCLSLCACGEANRNPGDNIPAGTAMPTQNDEPEEMAPAGTETDEHKNSAGALLSAEWLSYLCGAWEVLYRDDVDKIGTVVFCKDGTVTVGDLSLSWELQDENDGLMLNLISNGSQTGRFKVYLTDECDLFAYIQIDDQEIALYKPSHYEIIPITLDNIDEYFEIRYIPEIKKNEFDEMSQIVFYGRYVLKEEFYDRISQQMMDDTWDRNVVDDGAAELSLELGAIECKIDVENQTFEIVSFTPREADTNIQSLNFGGLWTPDTYGFTFARYSFTNGINLDLENGTGDNTNTGHNYELVRIKATLYLIAEND